MSKDVGSGLLKSWGSESGLLASLIATRGTFRGLEGESGMSTVDRSDPAGRFLEGEGGFGIGTGTGCAGELGTGE